MVLYFIFLFLDIVFILFWPEYRWFSKPLLMPLLGFYAYYKKSIPFIMYLAIVFAWLGDIFLQFSSKTLFLVGMASFLVMQALYIKVAWQRKLSFINWPLSILLLGVGIGFQLSFGSALGDFRIPVIVYSIFILGMALTAVNSSLSLLFKVGALVFVISDFVLAYNLFIHKSMGFSVTVMLTYGLAQFLIVRSFEIEEKL